MGTARISVEGEPRASIELPTLPSINDFVDRAAVHRRNSWGARASYVREWRELGRLCALDYLNRGGAPFERAFVVVRVWRPNKVRRDVHNVWVKPIFDGFTDAGLWADDSEGIIPSVLMRYEGLDPQKEGRVLFEVYDLA